jgi:hypothetical protein
VHLIESLKVVSDFAIRGDDGRKTQRNKAQKKNAEYSIKDRTLFFNL